MILSASPSVGRDAITVACADCPCGWTFTHDDPTRTDSAAVMHSLLHECQGRRLSHPFAQQHPENRP
jgi:hypothetical protein